MKSQMKFQKILMLVSLIIAALSFVYALSFCSGTVYQYGTLYLQTTDKERVAGARDLFNASQSYCTILVTLSIIFIVIIVLNYITASNSRRNYYITNYISIIVSVVYALVFAILLVVFVSDTFSYFLAIDAAEAEAYYSRLNSDFSYSISNFILGYVLFVVVLLDAVALVLNLIWKIKLMRGERALLAQGFNKEVA